MTSLWRAYWCLSNQQFPTCQILLSNNARSWVDVRSTLCVIDSSKQIIATSWVSVEFVKGNSHRAIVNFKKIGLKELCIITQRNIFRVSVMLAGFPVTFPLCKCVLWYTFADLIGSSIWITVSRKTNGLDYRESSDYKDVPFPLSFKPVPVFV